MYKRLKTIKRYIADWSHRKWPHAWQGYRYFRVFKKPLNEKEPKTYAERLIVAMRSQEFEKLAPYVDKWAVREYVHNKIGKEYELPLLAVYESPDQVQYELIPEGAYIKLNHGSGYNIAYHAEQKEQIQNQVENWYHADFSKIHGEVQYRRIPRKILVEADISCTQGITWEYSFFCFHGRTEFVQIYNKEHQRFEVSRDYEPLPFHLYSTVTPIEPKKEKFDQMRMLAEKLAAPFTFVRVDFLVTDKKIYFSELTFSPGAGLRRFTPDEYNYIFGRKLTYETDGVICRPELLLGDE